MSRHLFVIAVLIGVGFGPPGCGYRLVQYGAVGDDAPSISVITLANDSDVPGVDLMVSDAIRKAVTNRGGMRLVGDPASADYVLRGRVLPIVVRGRTFTGIVLALEHSVDMSLEVTIVGRDGTNIELSGKDLEVSDLYLSSADLEAGRKNRQEVMRRLSQLLAMRIHDVIDRQILVDDETAETTEP